MNSAFIKMESIRAKMDSERFKKDDILYDIKNAEMKIAESKIRIDQIKEQIIDKFGENIKLKSIKNYNLSDIAYKVEKTKRSIETIGQIN